MESRRLSLGANRPVVGNQPASRSSATTHKNTNDRNRASDAPDPMGTTSKARQSISPARKSRNKKRDLTSQLQHPRVTTSAAQFPRSLWSQPPAVQPYRSAVKMPTPVLTSLPVPEAMELATQMLPAPQSSPRRSASLPTLPLPPSFSYPGMSFPSDPLCSNASKAFPNPYLSPLSTPISSFKKLTLKLPLRLQTPSSNPLPIAILHPSHRPARLPPLPRNPPALAMSQSVNIEPSNANPPSPSAS